ncbi:uracil-DNA glycosylase [Malassezia nana]|uniref:Uracil-DNA glycosylase n=1 Tax=Malassezia nana TaxID=180528 RepID=A0AAF0EMP2_9BASI|nr:uracil-DNA glycosylase [Malassezia nana]
MGSPPVKRALSPGADEFDEFDTSADDLIRAVEESEGVKKKRLSSPPKATRPSAPVASGTEPPVYNHPYAGTKEDPLLLERTTMGKAWFDRLEPAMRQDSFARLKAFLDAEKKAGKTIYPPAHLIHSWSRTTPLEKIKVVIVGQDPYHQPGQACGHSFSVPMGKAVPASLQNIYKELKAEFPDFHPPSHGCLDGWARQGVLLLNACLTVNAGAAGSHHNRGWEPFTREILKTVLRAATGKGSGPLASMFANQSQESAESGPSKGVVFLAWGLPAAKTLAEAGR